MNLKTVIISLLVLGLRVSEASQFRFANSYQNHMVLQRASSNFEHRAKLWGFAEQNAFISLSLYGKQYSTLAQKVIWAEEPVWKILLDPIYEANGIPITIQVTQATLNSTVSIISLNDVLFGDVWVCSGQSNMEWPVAYDINGETESKVGVDFPKIRIFRTYMASSYPLYDFGLQSIRTNWSLPTIDVLPPFSAVCWFFGKELYKKLNVPIGLIQSAVGGTNIERWVSSETIGSCKAPQTNQENSYKRNNQETFSMQ
jgi:sialate O-acetylesterase